MKKITNLVSEVGGIIDTLSLSANEKKQIRSTIVDTLYRYASELEKEQAADRKSTRLNSSHMA